MIVCETIGNRAVTMSGHAQRGGELVCAGASCLANALVESIELVAGISDEDVDIEIRDGYLHIDLRQSANEKSDVLMAYFRTGMEGLARTYPRSVKVTRQSD